MRLMPVRSRRVSWISISRFLNCLSLDKLSLVQVWPASFKQTPWNTYGTTYASEPCCCPCCSNSSGQFTFEPFPTTLQLNLSIFSTVIGLLILPVQAISTIPCLVLQPNFHAVNRNRNSWLTYCVVISWPVASSKVERPFELPLCGFFMNIRWIVWIRLAMRWCAALGISLSAISAGYTYQLRIWCFLAKIGHQCCSFT